DKILVVSHDFTLKPEIARTSDGEWIDMWTGLPIKNLSLANLKTYDVGRLKPQTAYARRYPDQAPVDGERIPTLREVIALLKNHPNKNTQIWIEIKTSPEMPKVSGQPEAVADAVVEVLQKTTFTHRVRILSFDWRSLQRIQKIAPVIPTVYLSHIGNRLNNIKPGQAGPSPWTAGIDVDDYDGSIPAAIKAAGGPFWAVHYKYVTPANLAEAHKLGLKVFVWTPDRKRDMRRLLKIGVDGIITNRPDILKSLFNR
ncbi:MAG: glycerophosphodiester phosphodiesterase family protein, partial [Desulfobacterales bacterium]